jgi:outer membrane protein TolC
MEIQMEVNKRIILVFLMILSMQSIAQQWTITIDDAINLALKNNTDIKVAIMNVKKAEAAVDEAFG